MSKERLEELLELHEKAVVAYEDCDFLEMRGYLETLFLEGFIDYLIEQAERVQELEELEQEYIELNNDFTKLALENKRYREALEFYADTDNYKLKGRATISSLVFDGGIRARKALESEK